MIAITGSTGFVGKNLIFFLQKNMIPFRAFSRKKKNGYYFIPDFSSKTNWSIPLKNIETIVHLASKVHCFGVNNKEEIDEFEEINVRATENLVRSAALAGVKRFIFLSSIKVNGEYTKRNKPFCDFENDKPEGPYALSKKKAEIILRKICNENNIELFIIRTPLIYGPYVKANFLKLINLVEKGFPLPFGLINNERSICYVENLVEFIYFLSKGKNINENQFLFSDIEPISTKKLISIIASNLKSKTFLIPIPKMYLLRICKIIGKYQEITKLTDSLEIDSKRILFSTNFEIKYSSEEGIFKTIKWYLQNNQSILKN